MESRLKAYRKIDIFEQASYKKTASLLPDCILGMDIVSHYGTFPLPSNIKQKACKPTLQVLLIGHAKGNQQNCMSRTKNLLIYILEISLL